MNIGRFCLCVLVAVGLLVALLAPCGRAGPATPEARTWASPGGGEMLATPSEGVWRNYTNGNEVNDLAVEGDYVWAATTGGVVRWNRNDGSYVKYTTADGLADNRVEAIVIDGEGHKWFGTSGGVCQFDGATWTTYTTASGLASNSVHAIAIDEEGHKWFGTSGGVSEFDGATWTTYTGADGLADNDVNAIAIDGEGHKWFGTRDGGVSEFDGATWTTYTTADGLASNWVYAIAIDGAGHKWFGTRFGGVSEFDGATWTTYTEADGLAYNDVTAIAVDRAGHKWFGARFGGVSEFDGATWTTYTTTSGLASNSVHTIAIDGEGHKWFGTGGGVSEFDGATWTTYTTADGLADNNVYAIATDGEGHKWFGTAGGVSEFDGAVWTTYTTADGLVADDVGAIAIDGAGHKWFGTYGGGVSEFDGSTWTTYTTLDGLVDSCVIAIAIDGTGHKWFGTAHGVSEFDGSTWTTHTTADGLASNGVWAIAVDGAGHKWFGTNGGVSKFGGSTWTTYAEADGLADNYVNAIAIAGAGHKWFGTWGGGVSEFDGLTWTTYTTADGLVGNQVYAIAIDGAGHKWFGTADGVSEFDGSTWTTYTAADGLASNNVHAIAVDGAGHKWFGTADGVSKFTESPSAPTLYAISNPEGDGNYIVDWSDVSGASTYTLQEDDSAGFSSPVVRYSGGDSRYVVSGQPAGTWHYRVRASNVAGDSDWSNAASVTVMSGSDAYEPDDTCTQASVITTDGTAQQHTFHQHADKDWASFTVVSGTTYVVQATSTSSGADLELELYDACGGNLEGADDNDLGEDARVVFAAPSSGTYYVKALNHDPAVYGPGVTYELSVRAQTPGGVALIVAGHNDGYGLQDNILYATNRAYRTFLSGGIPESNVRYLSAVDDDDRTDADGDGASDVYASSASANVETAITTWAAGLADSQTPFYLYLMDHGGVDTFLAHGSGDTITPDELDGWLNGLEGTTGTPVSVIYEACHSGSFIDGVEEISEPGRVVIASTGRTNSAYAAPGRGARFSDAFFTALGQSQDLYTAFEWGGAAVEATGLWQTPWLDDDGDGVANTSSDGEVARGRGLASFALAGGRPPAVDGVWLPAGIQEGQGIIRAQVRDDGNMRQVGVWVVVYPPSFEEPEPSADGTMPELGLPEVALSDSDEDGEYVGVYEGFVEEGVYRLVVYAEDGEGNLAQPEVLEVRTWWPVYLPLLIRWSP